MEADAGKQLTPLVCAGSTKEAACAYKARLALTLTLALALALTLTLTLTLSLTL